MNPKTGDCCVGDFQPFRKLPDCSMCADLRWVTKTRFSRRDDDPVKSDIVKCPNCDGFKLAALKQANRTFPTIQVRDLTEEEASVFREWRAQGHHELDCLTWIEGRRYDPAKDETFLAHARIEFKRWRFLRETNK